MRSGIHLRLIAGGEAPIAPIEPLNFDRVFRQYAAYVATIGLKIMGRDDDLDDLVQEVFIEAHRSLRRLRDPGALKSWLARITVRRTIRKLRRTRVLMLFGLDAPSDYAEIADGSATPDERAQVALAYRALERLPAAERAVWVLRHVEGESLDAIAQMCACSKSTVQRRLRLAQDTLEQRTRHG
jgi:RNA polymerase sigma-70 factor (ECF subfamily)